MTSLVTTTHLSIMQGEAYAAPHVPENTVLEIKEIMPNYETFERLMVRVGGPWNWDKRPTHIRQNAFWRASMNDIRTKLFVLLADGREVGLCLAIRPRIKNLCHLHGLNPVEIKYFGLFLEETGKGYGGVFLERLFTRLFKHHDEIYLSTRSTNHKKVVPFYIGMGMNVIKREYKPDDVILPREAIPYKQAG